MLKSRRFKKSKRSKDRSSSLPVSCDPPRVVLSPIRCDRVRYSVEPSSGNITAQEILSFIQIGANSSSYTLCSAVRIRKIEMWLTNPTSTFNPAAYGIQWTSGSGTIGAPTRIAVDTITSPALPGYVKTKPPKGSFADMWHSAIGDSTPVFYFFAPDNVEVTMDITYEYTVNYTQTPNVAIHTVAPPVGELSYYSYNGRLMPLWPAGSVNINS